MTDRFEEDLGKFTYITLPQVKDYLSISSNTQDARLANIISYATGVVEHYIGQEVIANNYVELFDGGVSSLFVSRLPLNNVYQVTEFNGYEHQILVDPSTIGVPNSTTDSSLNISFYNSAHINSNMIMGLPLLMTAAGQLTKQRTSSNDTSLSFCPVHVENLT
jgi:hypothetical protein